MTRSGVSANTRHKKRKVQSPVARDKASAGLAPNCCVPAASSNQQNGNSAKANATGLAKRCNRRIFTRTGSVGRGRSVRMSKKLLEVHTSRSEEHMSELQSRQY